MSNGLGNQSTEDHVHEDYTFEHDGSGSEGDDHGGDYSARMDEIFGDGDHDIDENGTAEDDGDDEEEGFLYTGVDADPSGSYRDQLRDVLGPDHEEDELEERQVEKTLDPHQGDFNGLSPRNDVLSVPAPSNASPSVSGPSTPQRPLSPPLALLTPGGTSMGTPSKLARPYLHPTISRLRSFTPRQSFHEASGTSDSRGRDTRSPAPSHLSANSRSSSLANLQTALAEKQAIDASTQERQVFTWTRLSAIGDQVFAKLSKKASSVLGSPAGTPTVLAANGLICIGTDVGTTWVFDFKQTLQCVCGDDASGKAAGAVSALALSHDHTYLASGHVGGHILLYDLQDPQKPVRSVPPVTLGAVASGRQEGHIAGSRILTLGFIAGRHTAFVSSDDAGLSFYHSLGKLLFVAANDTLRILGKYPEDQTSNHSASGTPPVQNGAVNFERGPVFRRRTVRKLNTTLAMAPLPLGTAPHATDAYQVVAILTPIKLVIVGLKPSPKTWFRHHRDEDEGEKEASSRFKGTLAWFPSVPTAKAVPAKTAKAAKSDNASASKPLLAYSWGSTLHLIHVSETKISQKSRNPKNGKISDVQVGVLTFHQTPTWTADGDVLALQWLNANQIVAVTSAAFEVYDVNTRQLVEHSAFDALSLISPTLSHTVNGSFSYSHAVTDVGHSVRSYKGKVFLLGHDQVKVGTLLTWADRILAFVQNGDFLSAIELARSYYLDEAPGNKNGLPSDREQLQEVVGSKMRDLMVASARYTFSEDRMTDHTHVTSDGRGVDRTSLFEDLVSTCARACIALDNYEFLFEDLFAYYDETGIAPIFLLQLESFIMDGRIQHVPPRITQRLVSLHAERQRPDLAERIIWHIDPECLDIHQAIVLCQQHQLYDALIHVYTRAMNDYDAPIVELLTLIRRVQRYRRSRQELVQDPESDMVAISAQDLAIEPVVANAYKVFPYLANVLLGLSYPGEDTLTEPDASQAKAEVYKFVFSGQSTTWPKGEGAKLVLTAEEDGGIEPTYPYLRLLLHFDTEGFLHSLDIAFEDAYLNDEPGGMSRLVIIKILLDILSSPEISPADITLINIFVARNVPKYPQFVLKWMTPSSLHGILVSLADDADTSTREDRQLAAEYLLSVYTTHESDDILEAFERAGFYRILRSWHRQERQWAPLLWAYAHDPELGSLELFSGIEDVLSGAAQYNRRLLSSDLLPTIVEILPSLMQTSTTRTAALLDKHVPELHDAALDALASEPEARRYDYLKYLLGPSSPGDDVTDDVRSGPPSTKVSPALRNVYVQLLCDINPRSTVNALSCLPINFLDWPEVLRICEEAEVFEAVIWGHNRIGQTTTALYKLAGFEQRLTADLADLVDGGFHDPVEEAVETLERVNRAGVAVCVDHSTKAKDVTATPEDMWFQVLSGQIACVQVIAGCDPEQTGNIENESSTVSRLRSMIQETFATLMTVSSTSVSFPRLFKRLVESPKPTGAASGTAYTEFRAILTGMLENYRAQGDMLVIAKHLLDRDMFDTVEELTRERARGWAPTKPVCAGCRQALGGASPGVGGDAEDHDVAADKLVVSRTGQIFHVACSHPILGALP